MIVTCERCATQFQLDDSRVPPEGVRVRCSRCKHAFHIELPLSEAEKIQRAAAQAAENGSAEPESPGSTQDLPIESAVGPTVEGGAPTDDVLDDEESDWEFNDDRSRASASEPLETGGDGPPLDSEPGLEADASDSPDDVFGAGAAYDFAGEDAEGEESIGLEAESAPAAPLESEVEVPAAVAAAVEEEAEPGIGSSHDPFAPQAEGSPGDSPAEELGSPAEWDFFSSDEEPVSNVANELTDAAELLGSATPLRVHPDLEEDEEPGRSAWLTHAAQLGGWLVVCALFGIGLFTGLAPDGGASTSAASQEVAGLQVEDVSGQWIDNATSGPVLVVRGSLRNASGVPVSAGAPLRIELLDAEGQPIVAARRGLGSDLTPSRAREVAPESLQQLQDRQSLHGALASIPPQGARRFSAVLSSVPSEAAGFRFVVDEEWAEASAPPPEETAALDVSLIEPAPSAPESPPHPTNPDLEADIEDLVGAADPATGNGPGTASGAATGSGEASEAVPAAVAP